MGRPTYSKGALCVCITIFINLFERKTRSWSGVFNFLYETGDIWRWTMPWGDHWYVSVGESDAEHGDEAYAERDGRLLHVCDPQLRIAQELWVNCGEECVEDYAKLMEPKAPIFAATLRYLRKANEFCPFAPWVAQSCGYHIRVLAWPSEQLKARSALILPRLMIDFFSISPRVTSASQKNDPTTVVYAFSGSKPGAPSVHEHEGFVMREAETWRPHFHAMGLMLSEMFPEHSDSHGDGRYRSEIPLLICHRMHKEDRVFMGSPGRIEHYQKFFGCTVPPQGSS